MSVAQRAWERVPPTDQPSHGQSSSTQRQAVCADFMRAVLREGGPQCVETVCRALQECTKELLGGEFLVKLAVINERVVLNDDELATLHIVHRGWKHVSCALDVRTLPVATLPSVAYAKESQVVVYTQDYELSAVSFEDWEAQYQTHGVRCFMDLGALILMGKRPAALSLALRRLLMELASLVSQVLHSLFLQAELAVGQRVLQDILPQHVAASLTRKARSMTRSCGGNGGWDLPTIKSATSSSSSSHMTTQTQAQTTSSLRHQHPSNSGSSSSRGSSRMHRKSFALAEEKPVSVGPMKGHSIPGRRGHQRALETAAAAAAARDWLKATEGNPAMPAAGAGSGPDAPSEVPTAEREVTNMSQQCEPEDVMLLLHNLFARYDALCSQFGVYKYMACTGLLVETEAHANNLVDFGKALFHAASTVRNPLGGCVQIRVVGGLSSAAGR
ncbi:hypothetical protein QJQ45_011294 [Haematococcus lacustris]|nr:hypothetical protein QJQ45_011294 [Haematococcus lacustris]